MPIGTGDGQYFDDEFHYQAEGPVRKASDEASMTHQAEAPPDKVQRFVKDTTQSIADTLTAGPRLMQDFMEGKTSSDDPEAIRRSTDVASSTMGLGMLGAEKNALGMFGGRMSPSSVRYAEHMEKSGFPANDIKELTGLERGTDEMWRREFSDKNASVSLDKIPLKTSDSPSWTSVDTSNNPVREGEVKLGDILKHDELYSVYPDAKDIKVTMGQREGKGIGAYNIDDKDIYLKSGRSEDEVKATLLHEIQHWIQDKEGFSLSHPTTLDPSVVDKVRKDSIFKYASKDLEELLRDAEAGDLDLARKKAKVLLDKADVQVYRAQATEVEARNTQKRANMTDYERSRSLASSTEDYPRSEQIVQERDRMEDFLKRANAQRKQEQQGR